MEKPAQPSVLRSYSDHCGNTQAGAPSSWTGEHGPERHTRGRLNSKVLRKVMRVGEQVLPTTNEQPAPHRAPTPVPSTGRGSLCALTYATQVPGLPASVEK